ncbi:hypothetical protein Ade02nite_20820 [Paractinoplanes deccanensis]|uniref:Uncharacterized protein n=1 Tax=Paractinoplanes deccanensis TaxID=113561 RepID=A0ABQ3Y0B5_9ACTN|nr:hypothetical protein [Actinoplanes deccanensis]GID73441.1 hypothetical protein Ade02nite_20820 [Actinoplanes deccanensis]
MTTWTKPESISLSVNGVNHVLDALHDPATRAAASAYLDELTDKGVLYVLACEIEYRAGRVWPSVELGADELRRFIRERAEAA